MGKLKNWIQPGARKKKSSFCCPKACESRSGVPPRNLPKLQLLQIVPVTKRGLGPFIPGQCQAASARISYLPWRFNAAVNTHDSTNSLAAAVGEQLAADPGAAQHAARPLGRHGRFHVH